MRGAFSQQTQTEKNGRRNPDEPRRFLLEKKAQPKNNRQAAKGHIQRFDLNQPSFFYYPDVGHPNQSSKERAFRAKSGSRDGDKRNGDGEHR